MIHIIVISHGNFAKEMIESAKIIVGEFEDVYEVPLQPADTPEAFSIRLDSVIKQLKGQETIILIDMFSGTPYNIAARYVKNDLIECITGVNLPMLIEAILTRENSSLDELAASLTKSGTDSIVRLKLLLN